MQNLAGPNGDPDDELLSLAVLKHGRQVVCGRQSGSLSIFRRDAWEDPARSMTGESGTGFDAEGTLQQTKQEQTHVGCFSTFRREAWEDPARSMTGQAHSLTKKLLGKHVPSTVGSLS